MKVISIKKTVEIQCDSQGIKSSINLPDDYRIEIIRNGFRGVSLVKNLKPDDVIVDFNPIKMPSPRIKNPEDWLNEE